MGRRFGRLFWVFAAALLVRACVLEPVRLTDDAMAPRLHEGDVVLVSKLRYGLRVPGAGAMLLEWTAPQKDDLVVTVTVGDPPMDLLRRVSAVPGEKVTLPDGREYTLKGNEFFVAAEQKEADDSRRFGVVPRRAIIGRAAYLWMSKRPSTGDASQVESSHWRLLRPL